MTTDPNGFQVRKPAAPHWGPVLVLVAIAAIAAGIWGCGSNGAGLEDWPSRTSTTAGSGNIQGAVLAPVVGLGNVQARITAAAGAAVDATVYLEERPDLTTKTDTDGKFLLRNVPVGKYHVIAELLVGVTSYRQRSDLITLGSANTTQELPAPLQLYEARRNVVLFLHNRQTKEVITSGITATMWGRSVLPALDGMVSLGPVINGVWPVRIEGSGYYPTTLLVNFNENRQTNLVYEMTPLTAVDRNQAPFVEMSRDFTTMRTYQSGNLSATALDPEGDVVTYTWETSAGTLTNTQGATTVLTAGDLPGPITVVVTGTDSKGGTGKAVMVINVISGGNPPAPPSNLPPNSATDPQPVNGAASMGTSLVLRWSGSDPNGDALRYDLLLWPLGSTSSVIARNLENPVFPLNDLSPFTRYFWQVISRDAYDTIDQNPAVWQFDTGDGNNLPPFMPANPTPPNLSVDQLPNLFISWTGGDPNATDSVHYTVYLGTDSSNITVATTTTRTHTVLENLQLGKTYYWLVLAVDQRGGTTRGPRWQFSTYAPPNNPPNNPTVLYPASGAVNVSLTPQLRWTTGDVDGDALSCDVFLGTSVPLQKISSNQSSFFLTPPGKLMPSTTYFWEVVVRDNRGGVNASSTIWSFTTTAQTNSAPNVPTALTPANNGLQIATQPVFSWTGGDPDGDDVTYFVYLDIASPPVTQVAGPLSETHWSPPYGLAPGQQYHWLVTASDTKNSAVVSSVFNFTTASLVDSTPPTIVSVSPSHGETGVAPNSDIVITFSEAIDPSSVVWGGNLQLRPSRSGSWIWETPSRLRFISDSPMPAGSYNAIFIATGTVRDVANNILRVPGPTGVLGVNSLRSTFTVTPDIPLPSGFHSAGFSMTGNPTTPIVASIPEMALSKYAWAAIIGEDATYTGQISASRVAVDGSTLAPYWYQIPEAAFRELEKNLPPLSAPVEPATTIRAAITGEGVGTVLPFYIPSAGNVATDTPFPLNRVPAVCRASTDKLLIYVDTRITSPDYTLISDIRQKFEEIIQTRVQDYFGNEPPTGPNGDSRLTILLTDSMKPNLIGLFYGGDLYTLPESNMRKMLYVRYSQSNQITLFGTVAHEYCHLVTFYQKQRAAATVDEAWLSEGCSKYAEELTGFGMQNGDANTAQILRQMMLNWTTMSLTEFTRVENYGLSYLFVRFLAEDQLFKNTSRDAARALSTSALTGINNVESLTREPFSSTLGRFYLSLLLNRYNSMQKPDYGLSNLNLKGSYSGVNLPGVPFEAVPVAPTGITVSKHGCRYYRKPGDGTPNLTIQFSNLSRAARAWFLDERP